MRLAAAVRFARDWRRKINHRGTKTQSLENFLWFGIAATLAALRDIRAAKVAAILED